jgi:hypothetical protein
MKENDTQEKNKQLLCSNCNEYRQDHKTLQTGVHLSSAVFTGAQPTRKLTISVELGRYVQKLY